MRTHTQAFKEGIKQYGRQFKDTITSGYMVGNDSHSYIIQENQINRINYSVDTTLMKSVMQQLVVDMNIKLDDRCKELNYDIKLNGQNNSTIGFKKFNITKVEEQKDKKSYIYTCYDNMIKAMVDYESLGVTYPITIRDYLIAICSHLGLTFKNASDTFTNYNKEITSEHYIDADGNKMGYTFRDVLDDIAEAVGGFICIDNNGQLEIRYITQAVGKNMLNYVGNLTTSTYGLTSELNSDGSITTTGKITKNYVTIIKQELINNLKDNTYYTFSKKNSSSYLFPQLVLTRISDSGKEYITASGSANSKTFKVDKSVYNSYLLQIVTGTQTNWGNSSRTITNYYQLEEGQQATDYEPYGDTINEEYFNDKNVNIGKKVGAYNTLVLSRASDSDNIHRPTTLPQEPIELKISDNPILEQDNREDFIDGIFNQINGLEFYLNDFATTGILYYEIGDKYNVSIGDTIYPCLMLSDDIKRTTGLKENIVTKEPKQSVTDYKYSSTTDKVGIASRNAKILVDKANASIEQIVEAVGDNGEVTSASIIQSINNDTSQVSINANKIKLEGYTTINNGFAVDNNGSVLINDGDIEITDSGTQQESDSHIVIQSSDGTKKNFLTSNVVDLIEFPNNYTVVRSKYYPGYSNISYENSNYSTDQYTTQDSQNLYCSSTSNGHTKYAIYGSQTLQTRYDGNNTFEVEIETGNTTIGGDITVSGKLNVSGFVTANGFSIPYAYYFENSRETLYNISAWSNIRVPFNGHVFSTSHNNLFEKNGDYIKCKFTGKVMVIRQLSTDFTGEIDIADEFSWFTATGTKQNYSITIKNVNSGDNVDFIFSGGMSGTVTLYSARMILLRIG